MSIRSRVTSFKQWEDSVIADRRGGATGVRNGDGSIESTGIDNIRFTAHLLPLQACAVILTCLAVLTALAYTKAIAMPAAMAVVLYLVLRPTMRFMQKRRIPSTVGAALCLGMMSLVVVLSATYVTAPAKEWIDNAPRYFRQLKVKLSGVEAQLASMADVSEEITRATTTDDETEQTPVPVEIKQPELVPGMSWLSSTGGFASGLLVTFGLLFFLLAYGDVMIRNIIRGLPSDAAQAKGLMLLDDLQHGMSYYLFTITIINLLLGVATGLAMWVLGMPNALLIGVMAALFNFIPFLGAWTGTAVVFMIAVLQFDSFAYAMLPPLVYFSLTSIEGQFITPCILGRSMSLNPLLVFAFLVLWGWMWGIGGVFLAVPLLAVLKIVADYFPSMRLISRAMMTRVV